MPKRKRTVSTAGAVASTTIVTAAVELETTPTRRASKRIEKTQKIAAFEDVNEDVPLSDVEDEEFKTKSGSKSPSKRKMRKKIEEPVVYDIPPVDRKYTSFKGRLGYACLNTVLRAQKPESIFCSRTCRLDTIRKNGLDFAKDLGLQNCRDLYKLVEWNEENNIRFLRMSSEMFPFASHKEFGYDLEYAKDELKRVGDLAKRLGHRLTAHPGQFTQIGSPKENVVEASIRELEYHCQMMRYMGLDKDSVMIIHMGGVYGDKPATLDRFKENYASKLTDEMKARVVLENDEMCYNPDDLLPVCNELVIPIVLDYHHNWIYPSVHPLSTLIPMINKTWVRKGIKPKQHLSSPRPGFEDGNVMEKRGHADRCYSLPDELVLPPPEDGQESIEVDLMIEAKDKEQAVFLLYRIYDLAPVKHENLRPEKPQKPIAPDVKKAGAEANTDVAPDAKQDSPSKRGSRTQRGKTVKPEVTAADSDKYVAPVVPSGTPKKRSPRKKKAQLVEERPLSEEEVASLIDQEEVLVPVDGATVEVIKAEEHPEVAVSAKPENKARKTRKSKGPLTV